MKPQIVWLGQAAFKIMDEGKIIYIDPRYMKSKARSISHLFEKPDKADLVLFTHDHADHCDPSLTRKMMAADTVIIGPERCRKKIGERLTVIKPGESKRIADWKIEATLAYSVKHFRKPGSPWHPKGECVGYVISVGGKRIYHAGDTDFIPEMKNLKNIDVALLPIDGKFNMDIEDATKAIMAMGSKIAIPMHLIDADPYEFKKRVEAKSNTEVLVLALGETLMT